MAFVDWAKYVHYRGRPLWDRTVKIANERGAHNVATAIMVRIGMRAGFPDYAILAPIAPHAGLYLEAKRISGGKVSNQQTRWNADLIEFGYQAVICDGALEMIAATRAYFARCAPGDWIDNTRVSL